MHCNLTTDRTDEAVASSSWFTLTPYDSSVTLSFVGVKDLEDDGDQRFRVLIGPCRSKDGNFSEEKPRETAHGINEHVPFPAVLRMTPSTLPMMGTLVTVSGRDFDENCTVVIDGTIVTGPPVTRDVFWNRTGDQSEWTEWELATHELDEVDLLELRVLYDNLSASEYKFDECDKIWYGRLSPLVEQSAVLDEHNFTEGNITASVYRERVQRFRFVYKSSSELKFVAPAKCTANPSRRGQASTSSGGSYSELIVRNPNGADVVVNRDSLATYALYYTDKCAQAGWYGAGLECRPCFTGGECPGGFRVWPKPGFWNANETSGFVVPCLTVQRCLGGPDSRCAEGYVGARSVP